MPRYVILRDFSHIPEEEMEATGAKLKAAEDAVGIRWVRSWDTDEKGKVYCEYEAPSMEALLEATRRGGFPVALDAITQVLEPGMFR
ncbi:MAG: hypothetical protein QOI57_807 [Rubrobacteraceae bacterium]|jgi:hypothetical protein|nr:hypothetical protein [Rubrobacteraceae bacterium]